MPQATAGLIIGKGGSRVKSIQEESNCHINLTQKNEQLPTNERVVTIQNNESELNIYCNLFIWLAVNLL